MKGEEPDPRFTFDTFVVGPANRLACAAARRAAESPGASYNPLFFYSGSGLGKTHLLGAVAHHARALQPGLRIRYRAVEGYLDDLARALEAGRADAFRKEYEALDLLLLDDVQFLAGQGEAQEILLRTLDALTGSGGQIILASDRPPAEIDDLDDRLLSRFSGGLIVDIGPPEYETRVAIVRRKAEERGQRLQPGVAEAVARSSFTNVRELQGALNRVLAVQELEGRPVTAEEVPGLLGLGEEAAEEPDEFAAFLEDVASTVAEVVEVARWRRTLEEAAERWESRGYTAGRLRRILKEGREPEDPEAVVRDFVADVERLREVAAELKTLEGGIPDPARRVLRDPDRLGEARALLAAARERRRPFPALPPRPTLEELGGDPEPLAVRAARKLVLAAKPPYTPLFVVEGREGAARDLFVAAGTALLAARPRARVALVSAAEFQREFIRALETGLTDPWRERWRGVDALFVHGVERLGEAERAQDEFFHLFEELSRRGACIGVGAGRPPGELEGIGERLRSRFEGGLVVEFAGAGERRRAGIGAGDPWFRSREKLVWEWPRPGDRIVGAGD